MPSPENAGTSAVPFARPRVLRAAAVLGAAALALTACGDDAEGEGQEAESELEADLDLQIDDVELIGDGVLQVCSDVPYPPFEYYSEQGEVVGFDMDIADGIAEVLDADLEIVESSFDGIQSGVALNADTCDIAISGMGITEERQGNMLFSDSYLDDNLGLLAAADAGVGSTEDLDGVTVGVQTDTTGAAYAEEEGFETRAYDDSGLLIQGLESGQVDAAIGNISILGYQAGEDETSEFIEEIETGEQLGVAAQLENEQMIDAVNEILAEMESSGYLEEAENRWFHEGDTPEEGEGDSADDDGDESADDDADDEDDG